MGERPNARPKLVVNEPTLRSPTVKQMFATDAVGVAQQCRRALQPAHQDVLVRGLAEGSPELTAEVRRRKARRCGERGHIERFAVAGIDEVPRAQEVPCRRDGRHRLT